MSYKLNVVDLIENKVEVYVPIDIIKIENDRKLNGYLFQYYENLNSDEVVHEGFASLNLLTSIDRNGDTFIKYELEVLLEGKNKAMTFSGKL